MVFMWGHTGLRGGQKGPLKEIPETSGINLHMERILCKNSPNASSEITTGGTNGAADSELLKSVSTEPAAQFSVVQTVY